MRGVRILAIGFPPFSCYKLVVLGLLHGGVGNFNILVGGAIYMKIFQLPSILFFLLMSLFGMNSNSYATMTSTFNADFEGWVPTVPAETSWQPSGGNPDGYIRLDDISGSSGQILAPSSFLGNLTSLDAIGSISFDHKLFQTGFIGSDGIVDYEINLSGAGNSATWFSPGPSSTTDWVSLTAPLVESLWNVTGSWSSLLSSVSELRIRVEMVDNDASSNRDIAGIDNISLNGPMAPIPEPSTMILFGTGLAGLMGWRYRKKQLQ